VASRWALPSILVIYLETSSLHTETIENTGLMTSDARIEWSEQGIARRQ